MTGDRFASTTTGCAPRAARRLAPGERTERLRAQRVILATPADKVKLKVAGVQGEASLHDDVYRRSSRRWPTMRRARLTRSEEVNCLASPVTAGALPVGRIEQLFLLARSLGQDTSAEWAAFAEAALGVQGHRIVRDGKRLEPEARLQALHAQASAFETGRLRVMQAFGVGVDI